MLQPAGDGSRVLQVRPDGSRTAYVGGLEEVDYAAPTALTYRESGGTVVIEAEHYAGALPGTQTALGDVWQATTYYTGYSGDGAMQGGAAALLPLWLGALHHRHGCHGLWLHRADAG